MTKFFIENILYPAMYTIKGNRVRQIKNDLITTQSSNDLAIIQKNKLQKLLLHCIENVEFYKNIGITKEEITNNPYDVLENKIKPMRKFEFKENREVLLAKNIHKDKIMKNMTGGTGGIPMYFYVTREQVETYEAARFRGLSWYGISEGSKCIMIWGNPFDISKNESIKHRLREKYLKNRQVVSVYNISNDDIKKYVEFMNKNKPEFIYGYAMMVAKYATQMEKLGFKITFQPKAVVTTSEMLYEEDRNTIERVFNCKVASEYGARDAGILAYSCPHGNLHITAENCIIEVLDPITLEKLPDGSSGVFAVTDLNNFVEPKLRYLLGDAGSLTSKLCSCGMKLPIIKELDGKDDIVLTRKDGSFVHANILINLTRNVSGIREYQFVIHNENEATFNVVSETGNPLDTDYMISELQNQLDLKIAVKYLSSIPMSPSGKRRNVVKEY